MDETRARELYVRLTALKKHQEELGAHIEELDKKTVELREMIQAVSETEYINDQDELLVPLAHGIFMPATAKKVNKLTLHVGADTAVEKTPKETITILEKQQEELISFREQLMAQYEQLVAESARAEDEVRKEVGDV